MWVGWCCGCFGCWCCGRPGAVAGPRLLECCCFGGLWLPCNTLCLPLCLPAGDKAGIEPNHGYDDSRGDYITVVGGRVGG